MQQSSELALYAQQFSFPYTATSTRTIPLEHCYQRAEQKKHA